MKSILDLDHLKLGSNDEEASAIVIPVTMIRYHVLNTIQHFKHTVNTKYRTIKPGKCRMSHVKIMLRRLFQCCVCFSVDCYGYVSYISMSWKLLCSALLCFLLAASNAYISQVILNFLGIIEMLHVALAMAA